MDNTTLVAEAFNWQQWLRALLFVVAGYLAARSGSKALQLFAGQRLSAHQLFLGRMLVFYGILALFGLSALKELGFSFSVLLGAAGVVSVGIAFAAQTSASNLISGLFLLAEKPFQVGDVLRLTPEHIGEVIAIDLLSVKLRTFDNLMIRVPNETLIKSTFTNLSRFPIRRIDLVIGIAYGEAIEQAQALLKQVVDQHAKTLEHPEPLCVVTQFNASSVDIQLSAWVERSDFLKVKSELLIACKRALDDAGIEIPFPHTTLYAGAHSQPLPIKVVMESVSPKENNDNV